MTAQVALFNSLGVALASDTVTTHFSGNSRKTTNNAEKLLPLGGSHLVVVAHSGSTQFNWVHPRNVLAGWTEDLGAPLPQIGDYPISMISWLDNNSDLLDPESEKSRVLVCLGDHFAFVAQNARWILDEMDDPKKGAEALLLAATRGLQHLESLDVYPGASDEADEKLIETMEINLEEFLGQWFSEMEGFADALPVLLKSAPLVLSRSQPMQDDVELAFVGFGASDYFARSVRLRLRARYGGKCRFYIEEPFGADNRGRPGIATFAQSDAVHGFLRGGQHALVEEAIDFTWDAVYQLIDGDNDVETANAVASSMRHHLEAFRKENYSDPILDTIAGMSLLGLVDLGESLVGMQATFSSAAGSGAATVGGFIETMIISRSNGVQWVKRLPGAVA